MSYTLGLQFPRDQSKTSRSKKRTLFITAEQTQRWVADGLSWASVHIVDSNAGKEP